MTSVAFIGCSSTKLSGIHPAGRKYDGDYWVKRATLAFQEYDDVYIISAKFGFVHHLELIDDYDVKLGREVSVEELRRKCMSQRYRLPDGDEAVILAGEDYVEAATPALEAEGFSVTPLFQSKDIGGIGYQIGWLTDRMEEVRNDD